MGTQTGQALAAVIALTLVAPSVAEVRQSQPAPQTPAPTAAAAERSGGPLYMYGWSFSSIIRNGGVVSVILTKPKGLEKDAPLWRGLQATSTIGNRGFEVGVGYGQLRIAQIPVGFGFRGLAGRTWKAGNDLASDQWYAGGEGSVIFAFLRLTAGVVVPTSGGVERKPIFTASVGAVLHNWKRPKGG